MALGVLGKKRKCRVLDAVVIGSDFVMYITFIIFVENKPEVYVNDKSVSTAWQP